MNENERKKIVAIGDKMLICLTKDVLWVGFSQQWEIQWCERPQKHAFGRQIFHTFASMPAMPS